MGRLRTRFSFLVLVAVTAIFLSFIYQIFVDRFGFPDIYISWFPALLCFFLAIITLVAAIWVCIRLQLLPKIRESEAQEHQRESKLEVKSEPEKYAIFKEKIKNSTFARSPIPAEVGFWLVCLAKTELMASAFFVGGYGAIVIISISGFLNKIPGPTLRVFQGTAAIFTAILLGVFAYLLEGFCILRPPKEKELQEARIS